MFGEDDADSDEGELEIVEIIEATNSRVTNDSRAEHRKGDKVKAADAEESRKSEDVEIFPQSVAFRHALLSNFMSS